MKQRVCRVSLGWLIAVALCLGGFLDQGSALAEERFDCVIEPSRSVELGSHVMGVLKAVNVGRGDKVSEGQILFKIEDRVEVATVVLQRARAMDTASLRAKQADLALAMEREKRTRKLLGRGVSSRDEFDEIAAEVKVNRGEFQRLQYQLRLAGLELARDEAELSLRTVVSPLDGFVMQRLMSPGEVVEKGSSILHIVDLSPLYVEVFIPAVYYAQFALGQTGLVQPQEPVGSRYRARIIVIDRVFDATSNTFGVRLALDNPNELLPAGQRCTVAFDVRPIKGLLEQ